MKKSFKKTVGAIAAAAMIAVTPIASLSVSAVGTSSAVTSASASTKKLSQTSMTLTQGYRFTLKLDGKTSGLTYTSADTSIATVSKDGKVTGKKPGNTIIYVSDGSKVYSCSVRVVATKISTSKTSYNLKEGKTLKTNVKVKGDKIVKATSSDKDIATVSWGKEWKDDTITLYIKGKSSGTVTIKLYNPDYPKDCKTLKVTVGDGNSTSAPVTVPSDVVVNPYARYYIEKEYNLLKPSSMTIEVRRSDDKIVYWADEKTSKLMYMVVPYNHKALEDGQYCIPLSVTINTDSVYYAGEDYYWYLFFKDTGYFASKRLDIAHPKNNPDINVKYGEKLVWNITSGGMVEYMIVSEYSDIDFSKYNYVLNHDGTPYFVNANYYKLVDSVPRKKMSSDIVLSWNNANGSRSYMLVPENYDKVRAESIRAKDSGVFQYYTVYSIKPRKTVSSDVIIDYWNENADDYRYILVPRNYNENKVDRLINEDIESADTSYSEMNVQDVINGINAERRKSGIRTFKVDPALTAAAEKRASELSQKFSHKRPDGTSYVTALEEAGAEYEYSDEIILRNMDYSSDVLTELFEDPDYYDTLLTSLNRRIGVAYNSDKDYYVIIVTD